MRRTEERGEGEWVNRKWKYAIYRVYKFMRCAKTTITPKHLVVKWIFVQLVWQNGISHNWNSNNSFNNNSTLHCQFFSPLKIYLFLSRSLSRSLFHSRSHHFRCFEFTTAYLIHICPSFPFSLYLFQEHIIFYTSFISKHTATTKKNLYIKIPSIFHFT